MKPYIDENDILHYIKNGIEKTFDCSNDNVAIVTMEHNDTYTLDGRKIYKDWLPDEVVKALLQTGEFYWTKGDNCTDYFSEVYHKCWEARNTNEKVGNVSSNPCYGWIRNKDENGNISDEEDCPRCRAIWPIYNCKRYKPLKWKIWDFLLLSLTHIQAPFNKIKVFFRELFFVNSEEGKQRIAIWADEIDKSRDSYFYLIKWRKPWLKPILKISKAKYWKLPDGKGFLIGFKEQGIDEFIDNYLNKINKDVEIIY